MSLLKIPDPAKLVIGCLLKDRNDIDNLFVRFESLFGNIDMISRWLDFDYTDYYEKEMGTPLSRKVFVFKNLIEQEDLAGVKERTNEIEKKYSRDGRRTVNIDPGYLLASRFILATGKDYSHRIFIGRKIYADLTLMYSKTKGFTTLPWTYPDYASKEMISFLSRVRDKYILDLKNLQMKKDTIEQ